MRQIRMRTMLSHQHILVFEVVIWKLSLLDRAFASRSDQACCLHDKMVLRLALWGFQDLKRHANVVFDLVIGIVSLQRVHFIGSISEWLLFKNLITIQCILYNIPFIRHLRFLKVYDYHLGFLLRDIGCGRNVQWALVLGRFLRQ